MILLLCLSGPLSFVFCRFNLLQLFYSSHHHFDMLFKWSCFPILSLFLLLLKGIHYIRFLQSVATLLKDALKRLKLMLLLHPFILTLCSCCINDGVNYIIQNLMLVGNHNLIECLSNLPNECNSVVDVLHHMLQNLKVVRAASSNSPLLFRHDTYSKSPRR